MFVVAWEIYYNYYKESEYFIQDKSISVVACTPKIV